MNRIVAKFAALKSAGKKGLVVYIGAGDPNLEATRQLASAFDHAGVDVLELGVPFSDPLADGLVNQLAAQRGLESGTTPPKLLATIADNPQAVANSDRSLYLFQPHPQSRPGEIYRRQRESRRGRPAGFGFAAGRIGQLRGVDEETRPLPYLSRRTDHAGRPHGTHRQARQRIHLLHLARRRHGNAVAASPRISPRRLPKFARTRICPSPSASAFPIPTQAKAVAKEGGRLRGRQRHREPDRRTWQITGTRRQSRRVCEVAG